MKAKISVSCRKCGCTCELAAEKYQRRDVFGCPNCGMEFPKEVFAKVEAALAMLKEIPDEVSTEKSGISDAFYEEGERAFTIRFRPHRASGAQ